MDFIYKIGQEEAGELIHVRIKDELSATINARFNEIAGGSQEFWHGVLSGLTMAMVLYQESEMPAEAKDIAIVEMCSQAARRFLGQEGDTSLQ